MASVGWFGQNWFILLQSVGIIGGLLFTAAGLLFSAVSLRSETEQGE